MAAAAAMDITAVLQAAQAQDATLRTQAEAQLKAFQEQNYPTFLYSLAVELANNDKPGDSRRLAGLILKNALDAKDEARKVRVCGWVWKWWRTGGLFGDDGGWGRWGLGQASEGVACTPPSASRVLGTALMRLCQGSEPASCLGPASCILACQCTRCLLPSLPPGLEYQNPSLLPCCPLRRPSSPRNGWRWTPAAGSRSSKRCSARWPPRCVWMGARSLPCDPLHM